ncbi:MAG: hypothetical protein KAI66_14770, partial [Lentisphaeria bacterium]|nr:hypothetical protein [Lentisphaeria bacterium]
RAAPNHKDLRTYFSRFPDTPHEKLHGIGRDSPDPSELFAGTSTNCGHAGALSSQAAPCPARA